MGLRTAFASYAAVLTTADPTRGADLFEYMRTIVQAASEFSGDAWQKYDTAFTVKAANRLLTRWADPDGTLWNRAFSGLSKASALCAICLSNLHCNSECPLYHPGPSQPRRSTGAGPRSVTNSGSDQQRTVSLNWNRGRCKLPRCHRAHVCATKGCWGDHRFLECPNRRS